MRIIPILRQCSKVTAIQSVAVTSAATDAVNISENRLWRFVPEASIPADKDMERLGDELRSAKRLVVLTGAGMSTESGIPDYRSEGVGLYARTKHRPIRHQEFVKDSRTRQRYWARNFVGWPRLAGSTPNLGHMALCRWEREGRSMTLVTQNVDELHAKAGSVQVTELHGSMHRVKCLDCSAVIHRGELHKLFIAANQGWLGLVEGGREIAPDGDTLLAEDLVKDFVVPGCPSCRVGVLKPDVVFFGDNVALPVVENVYKAIDLSDALLVAGSSLEVYSGFRFAVRARQSNKKLIILNIGRTRADNIATYKLEAQCGPTLHRVEL